MPDWLKALIKEVLADILKDVLAKHGVTPPTTQG